jgi:hypothetical protein
MSFFVPSSIKIMSIQRNAILFLTICLILYKIVDLVKTIFQHHQSINLQIVL